MLYDVLLVDDERWIVESLRGTVDWHALGFRIVGSASNGIEAYERISRERPHVALVDIRMPGMSGMELIGKLKESGIATKCIVASGYAEFEYARQAVVYGASGYCVKPFRKEELEEALLGVRAALNRDRQVLRREIAALLLERGDGRGAAELREALRLYGFRETEGAFFAVCHWRDGAAPEDAEEGGKEPPPSPFGEGLAVRVGSGMTAYLLRGGKYAEIDAMLRHAPPPGAKGAGIGERFHRFDDARVRLDETMLASYDYFLQGKPATGKAGPRRQLEPLAADTLEWLLEAFRHGDPATARLGVRRLEELFAQGRYDMRHARKLYHWITAHLYRLADGEDDADWIDDAGLTEMYESVPDMLRSLLRMLPSGAAGIRIPDSASGTPGPEPEEDAGPPESGTGSPTLQQVLRYIREHYTEPLAIQEIARRFYLHPNYLSTLFKKELNVSFTKFVTMLRMKQACRLLEETALPVHEIAERVGYRDYFYFAKWFKKQIGATPTEYRASKTMS